MPNSPVPFGEAFANFFTGWLGFSFVFECICIAFLALQCTGRAHLRLKTILTEIGLGIGLVALSILFSAIGSSISAAFVPTHAPLFLIIFLLIPNIAFVAITSRGNVVHRIMRTMFFFSVVYLATEIAHHYNVLVGPYTSGVGREIAFCVPYLPLVFVGLAVGTQRVHHVRNVLNPLTVMCFLIWVFTFLFAVVSSNYQTDDVSIHAMMLVLMVLLDVVDFWGMYIYYHVDKNQRTIAVLTAQTQLNEAASVMLRMNEDSIARTTMARHDLKNTLSFVSQLISEGNYEQALAFLDESVGKVTGELPIVDCGNSTVSSIMNLEQKKADLTGVVLKYRLIVPPVLSISDTTLCSLMTNIIDNAVAGAKESGMEGYVDFSMITFGSVLRIHCDNPTCHETVPMRSTKKGSGHGYGSAIIKHVVKELGGYVTSSIADGKFNLDAVINLDFGEGGENHA